MPTGSAAHHVQTESRFPSFVARFAGAWHRVKREDFHSCSDSPDEQIFAALKKKKTSPVASESCNFHIPEVGRSRQAL